MALFGWLAGCQPAVLFSHINSAPAISRQPASSIFLSHQFSTSHQPPASRTRPMSFFTKPKLTYDSQVTPNCGANHIRDDLPTLFSNHIVKKISDELIQVPDIRDN
jgi:hypothetical protein